MSNVFFYSDITVKLLDNFRISFVVSIYVCIIALHKSFHEISIASIYFGTETFGQVLPHCILIALYTNFVKYLLVRTVVDLDVFGLQK